MATNLACRSREELWKLCYTWWVPAYMYSQYPTCFYSFEWLLLGGCGWYLYIYLTRRESDNSLPIFIFLPPVILPSSIPACSVLTLPLNRIEALHLLLHRFTSLAHLEVMNEHISQISCSPVLCFIIKEVLCTNGAAAFSSLHLIQKYVLLTICSFSSHSIPSLSSSVPSFHSFTLSSYPYYYPTVYWLTLSIATYLLFPFMYSMLSSGRSATRISIMSILWRVFAETKSTSLIERYYFMFLSQIDTSHSERPRVCVQNLPQKSYEQTTSRQATGEPETWDLRYPMTRMMKPIIQYLIYSGSSMSHRKP